MKHTHYNEIYGTEFGQNYAHVKLVTTQRLVVAMR